MSTTPAGTHRLDPRRGSAVRLHRRWKRRRAAFCSRAPAAQHLEQPCRARPHPPRGRTRLDLRVKTASDSESKRGGSPASSGNASLYFAPAAAEEQGRAARRWCFSPRAGRQRAPPPLPPSRLAWPLISLPFLLSARNATASRGARDSSFPVCPCLPWI
jgi:hypothetical protein